MIFSLAIAHAQINRAKLGGTSSIKFPAHVILDERAQPVIASSGQVGFISSVTDGSVISFSLASGKMLSTMTVGHTLGPLSMIELDGRRLLAAPTVNDPQNGHPATVSILDVTSAKNMELHALIALPPAVQITPATRAYLTKDAKFCIIASSFADPALFSISIETGQMVSWMPLLGRPSETAFYDKGNRRTIAVVSAQSNELVVVGIDAEGNFSLKGNFTPPDASFNDANNPAFSSGGRSIYIAAAKGDKLFQVDSMDGSLLGSINVALPQQVSVTRDAYRRELIGVTRIAGDSYSARGGVTVITKEEGNFRVKSEFNPPPSIEFSPANNVAFSKKASVGFVGTATGMLFAFDVETGELQSHQTVGSELRRLALSEKMNSVAVVRSSSRGDEVIISNFEIVDSEETQEPVPTITSLKPDMVEQGRKQLKLIVFGDNFTNGSSVVVGSQQIEATLIRGGSALEARLPKSLFKDVGLLPVTVKLPSGESSEPKDLSVVKPTAPTIDRINPTEVPGPSRAFTLKVIGKNFHESSVINIDGNPVNTQLISSKELRTEVGTDISKKVKALKIKVTDAANQMSDEKTLTIFGPRIKLLNPDVENVVAGARGFKLKIVGENFRSGARVEINNEPVPQGKVRRQSNEVIRVAVPRRFFDDAGELPVVVRNDDNSASEPMTLNSVAPEIKEFLPGKVLAGLAEATVVLKGEHFRKGLRVLVAKDGGELAELKNPRVRFRSSRRIVINLNGELSTLLAEKGDLRFQIVNPQRKGEEGGVPSEVKEIKVVGPEITEASIRPIANDELNKRLVIEGANFHPDAIVEFVKQDGSVIRRQPEKFKANKLSLAISVKRLDALGVFTIKVINPNNVRSDAAQPQESQIVEGINQ